MGRIKRKIIPFDNNISYALESFDRPARDRSVDLGSGFESRGTLVNALPCCQRLSVKITAGSYGATGRGGPDFLFGASYSEFIDGVVPHERESGEIGLRSRRFHQSVKTPRNKRSGNHFEFVGFLESQISFPFFGLGEEKIGERRRESYIYPARDGRLRKSATTLSKVVLSCNWRS